MALEIERREKSFACKSADQDSKLNLLALLPGSRSGESVKPDQSVDREIKPPLAKQQSGDLEAAPIAERQQSGTGALGFELVRQAPGVQIFHRNKDYVIAIDLAAGAGMRFHTGQIAAPGRSPDFHRINLSDAFHLANRLNPRTFAVFNGQFFDNNPKPTGQVAFALKIDGNIVSQGFARPHQHAGRRLSFELSPGGARIVPYDEKNFETFRTTSPDNALVSLRTDVDRQSTENVGRTFIGLTGNDREGYYSKVLVFLSSASTQAHAESVLRKFGAGPQIQLDGGGSTQFKTRDRVYISSPRTIPQFISIEAAPPKSPPMTTPEK